MFRADFLHSIQPDSPEELFVRSVDDIADAYRYSTVFDQYHHARFNDFIERQNRPLYIIDGNLSYGTPPSDETVSCIWKERLLSYGKAGKIVVNAIGGLKLSTDLLLGKQIDFCMPYKHNLNSDTGYINGNAIDYAPAISEDPALFIQIGSKRTNGQGVHFPILGMCNISIT